MDNPCNLKFFQKIIWVDPNKATIHAQAVTLIWMFGQHVDICDKASVATAFARSPTQMCLILCSSWVLEDIHKTFCNVPNVYPKFIVFCGSALRAIQIKCSHPYRDAVEAAYSELGDLINGITEVDNKLKSNPSLMRQKVKIEYVPPQPQPQPQPQPSSSSLSSSSSVPKKENKPEMIPVVPMDQNANVLSYLQNQNYPTDKLEKMQQQKQMEKQKQQQQPQISSSQKSQPKIQQQPQQQPKKQPKVAKARKTPQGTQILWVYKQQQTQETLDKLRNDFLIPLQYQGYPIDKLDSLQILADYVRSEDIKFVLISNDIELESIKCQINNLLLTLKVVEDSSSAQNQNDETHVQDVQTIVKCLDLQFK